MPIYRYHTFVWEDEAGMFMATPVEDLDDYGDAGEELVGIADTEREAKQQLIEFLLWANKENEFLPEPGLQDVQCNEFAVDLRPEYQERSRVFPCSY